MVLIQLLFTDDGDSRWRRHGDARRAARTVLKDNVAEWNP
jgi:hypothetical protein